MMSSQIYLKNASNDKERIAVRVMGNETVGERYNGHCKLVCIYVYIYIYIYIYIYMNDILRPIVLPYRQNIGEAFVFMDDNLALIVHML